MLRALEGATESRRAFTFRQVGSFRSIGFRVPGLGFISLRVQGLGFGVKVYDARGIHKSKDV